MQKIIHNFEIMNVLELGVTWVSPRCNCNPHFFTL